MVNSLRSIPLREGRIGTWANGAENNALALTYDMTAVLSIWPDAVPSVAYERADGEKYAHACERDGDMLYIPLTFADTAVPGTCKIVVTMTNADGTVNSTVYYGTVTQGIDTLGETPTPPEQGIIEQCNNAASRAELAAKRAEAAAGGGGGGGAFYFETDETLTLENGILSVNTADTVEEDNTLPVTSAAVNTTVGNINALLSTI